jgi:hypothetical protein
VWLAQHPHLVDDVECGDGGAGAAVDEEAIRLRRRAAFHRELLALRRTGRRRASS